jgi:hypothetical protein
MGSHQHHRQVGIIGSRQLPVSQSRRVRECIQYLLQKGYRFTSGGAVGADQYCLEALLHFGVAPKCTVFSAWKYYSGFPATIRALMKQYKQYGGTIQWGPCNAGDYPGVIRMVLLNRNKKLVDASYGVVAFIDSSSRGSIFTLKYALKKRKKVVVFPHNCELPEIAGYIWHPLKCTGPWSGAYVAKPLKGEKHVG